MAAGRVPPKQTVPKRTVRRPASGDWYVMPVTSHADVDRAAAGAASAATRAMAMASFIVGGRVCAWFFGDGQ